MGVLGSVAKENEGRWVDRDLGSEDDLQSSMVEFWSRVHGLGIVDYLVKQRSGNPPIGGFVSLFDSRQYLIDSPAR